MVALGVSTSGGNTIFAKNSDRPANEAQPLILVPAASHSGGFSGTQFVDVPQVEHTYRHVGSKPYWCAGYEHGFNEHQVVIGNEALPSLLPESKELRLVGMEILRLGLERSKTAVEAVDVITGLVSEYGQGKFSNDAGVRTYDNIYLISDPASAYVVECVGYDWAVKQVSSVTSISNVGQIGKDADRVSPGSKSQATRNGLFDPGFGDSFAFNAFADPENSASGLVRQCRSEAMLAGGAGQLDVRAMISVLTDHSNGENPEEVQVVDVAGDVSICLHRRSGEMGASTASLVADLCETGERLPIYWTGLYSPCMTVFLPNFIEGDLPSSLGIGEESESSDSPWWDFYRLTQHGLETGAGTRAEIRAELSVLQDDLFDFAYDVAKEARQIIANGDEDAARVLLTKYMAENAQRVISKVKSMIPATSTLG
jgi:dipeptidase